MAAGIIFATVTTTTGETVELPFYVDETSSPTTWIPAKLLVNAAGDPIAFGSGTNGPTVPRFALATDSPGVRPNRTTSGTMSDGFIQVGLPTDQALPAGTNTLGKVDHTSTGIGHGVKTVTSAGTDEALASSTAAKWVTIQAQTDNTGWIAVGASGVDATEATGTGVLLDAGESITIPIDNLADISIDATVNGEGVRYTYGT